jgi:hypothetical protein
VDGGNHPTLRRRIPDGVRRTLTVDPTESIEPGRAVIVWRVDIVYLAKTDWKYEGSSAGAGGGERTHTFGVKRAAEKLKGKQVYLRSDIVLRSGKPIYRGAESPEG